MALYRYFSTKDELVDALLNRVLGRMEPPSDSASWIEDLGGFARNHRDMLSRHRWAVTALFAHPVPGPNALPIGEWALRILARAGGAGESLAEDLADPDVAQAFPLTASVAGPMSRYGSAEHELVLGQLLAGIPAGAG